MSIELITKAFKTKTANSTQKLILIKLADNANDDGQCFPSHRHIADQCQCTRRTVINAIKALEEQGLLTIEERRDFNSGQQKSNIYHLHLDGVGNLEEMESDSGSGPEDSPPENPENGGEGDSPGSETGSHLGVNNIHGGSEKYSQGEGEEYSHITVTSSNRQDNRQLNRQEKASKPAKKFDPKEALKEFGVGDDLIEDFLKVRKTKKAPLTKTALQGFIREAKKADVSLSHAIRFTIERNWQGFNAGWYRNAMGGFNNQASPKLNSTQISQDFGGGGIRMGRGARQVFQNQGEGEQQ